MFYHVFQTVLLYFLYTTFISSINHDIECTILATVQLARSLPRNTAALRTGFRMRVEAAAIITNTQVWPENFPGFEILPESGMISTRT